jgi:hypothetical protein
MVRSRVRSRFSDVTGQTFCGAHKLIINYCQFWTSAGCGDFSASAKHFALLRIDIGVGMSLWRLTKPGSLVT